MTATMVDSNVLLDLISRDEHWLSWSRQALAAAANDGRVVINAIIYAEISTRYAHIDELENALPRQMLEREPIPFEAAFLAGKVFYRYRKQGGRKTSPLPDFLIGAHAAVAGYRLLTRDPKRYRATFPRLDLIAPSP